MTFFKNGWTCYMISNLVNKMISFHFISPSQIFISSWLNICFLESHYINKSNQNVYTLMFLIVLDWVSLETIPTYSRKGEQDHSWMNATRYPSTPSDLPLRPLYWLFRVATTSLHIFCINIIGYVVLLEKTRLHLCFLKIQRVIGLTKGWQNLRFGINKTWVDIANTQ